jgi:hypothetical protein
MPSTSNPAAILYAPSINELVGQGVIDGLAHRIARTLKHQDEVPLVDYDVRVVPTEPYADSTGFTEVREVLRSVPGGQPVVIIRVYNLDYQPALAGKQPEGNVFSQVFSVARVWAWMMYIFLQRIFTVKSINRNQKTAVFAGAMLMFALTLCLAWLIVTAVQAAVQQVGANPEILPKLHAIIPPSFGPHLKAHLKDIYDHSPPSLKCFEKVFYETAQWIRHKGISIVSGLLVLAGVVGLSFKPLRTAATQLIGMFLSFNRYLDNGLGRATCTGKFNDLLEHILEKEPRRVDIIAYSMGSLIALDALFPSGGDPNYRLGYITTVSTVGCPFDIVRTFWPDYFAGRTISGQSLKWINVFSPVDLLGSNFANDDGDAATRGINATCPAGNALPEEMKQNALIPKVNLDYDHAGRKELNLPDAIFGGAYLAHSQYWVQDNPYAESCFNVLIPNIYPKGEFSNPPADPKPA